MIFTSSNLQQKLELLTPTQLSQIKHGFKWIQSNLNHYVIIGGVAVVSYNVDRPLTPDLDIIVHDIDLVQELLRQQNIKYSNLTNNLGITVHDFNLDILDVQTGNKQLNKLILNTPNKHLIYSQEHNVIQAELLTILKLELGRSKDLDDGLKLFQTQLNQYKFRRYLGDLKASLNEYDSLCSYIEMFV